MEYGIIEDDVASLLQESILYTSTFELRTYDAMLTTLIHHIEENDIEVVRDKMT